MRCEISISGSSPATSRDQGTLLDVGEEQSESWGTVQPLLEVAVQTENLSKVINT